MHVFDPNGSIAEYRKEMARRELHKTIVYAVVTVVMSVLILAAIEYLKTS